MAMITFFASLEKKIIPKFYLYLITIWHLLKISHPSRFAVLSFECSPNIHPSGSVVHPVTKKAEANAPASHLSHSICKYADKNP